MKILMFGRGVISTLYGWALEKAGNEVEFYVRPGRAESLGASVSLDLRDGRTNPRGEASSEEWPVTLVEEVDPERGYDVIVVSVNHDQVGSALAVLRDRVGDATVLMFNNLWSEPSDVAAALPAGHVVWGFLAVAVGSSTVDCVAASCGPSSWGRWTDPRQLHATGWSTRCSAGPGSRSRVSGTSVAGSGSTSCLTRRSPYGPCTPAVSRPCSAPGPRLPRPYCSCVSSSQ